MIQMVANNDRRQGFGSLLAAAVLRLRRERGWTQLELAERANLSRLTINRIENGHSIPEWDIACSLAEAFDVSLDEFRAAENIPAKSA